MGVFCHRIKQIRGQDLLFFFLKQVYKLAAYKASKTTWLNWQTLPQTDLRRYHNFTPSKRALWFLRDLTTALPTYALCPFFHGWLCVDPNPRVVPGDVHCPSSALLNLSPQMLHILQFHYFSVLSPLLTARGVSPQNKNCLSWWRPASLRHTSAHKPQWPFTWALVKQKHSVRLLPPTKHLTFSEIPQAPYQLHSKAFRLLTSIISSPPDVSSQSLAKDWLACKSCTVSTPWVSKKRCHESHWLLTTFVIINGYLLSIQDFSRDANYGEADTHVLLRLAKKNLESILWPNNSSSHDIMKTKHFLLFLEAPKIEPLKVQSHKRKKICNIDSHVSSRIYWISRICALVHPMLLWVCTGTPNAVPPIWQAKYMCKRWH